MKHRLDPLAIAVEPGEEPVDRHDLEEVALGDVAPFIARAEPVDDDEVGAAGPVELRRQHRADEPAAAGDHQHQAASSFERARAARLVAAIGVGEGAARIASISRVVEWPSTRSTSTTRPPEACTSSAPTTPSIV